MRILNTGKLKRLANKCKTNFIASTYAALITALSASGGVFFVLDLIGFDPMLVWLASALAGLAAPLIPIRRLARYYDYPRERVRWTLTLLGGGRMRPPADVDGQAALPDIAESFDTTNRQLPEKIQSIIRNTNRLSEVEEELSSRFRPRNSGDRYTRDLVCKLKICTSRLKNELKDFSFDRGEMTADRS
ncbi:MAG: hypothetical protein JSU69_05780 [Candidatus Zixiibacteriota bacterium]|nr:MAG: hypothetical protein JSU69_05780 [candidate division Zixibacteria bacterium]